MTRKSNKAKKDLIAEAGLSDADTAALESIAALETAEAEGLLPIVEPAAPEAVAEAVAEAAAPIVAETQLEKDLEDLLEIQGHNDPDPEPVAAVAPITFMAVLSCRVYQMAGDMRLSMHNIMSAIRTIRTGTAGWWYMHSRDGQFGNGGTRYTHRYAVVDGIGDALGDGTRPVGTIRFVGLAFDEYGVLDGSACASWVPSAKDPIHEPTVRLDSTRNVLGLQSTAGNGGPAPQCADTRGATITLHPNGGTDDAPCIVISGAKGGRYALSGIIDNDGNDIA